MKKRNQPNEAAFLEKTRLQAVALVEEKKRKGTWGGSIVAHTAYQTKPVEWLVEYLGIPEHTLRWTLNPGYDQHRWDGTVDPIVDGLEAIARNESIAVSSGTSTGKSYALGAGLMLWFLACHEDSIVLTIGPREKQLLKNLWKYVGVLYPRFKRHFPTSTLISGTLRMLGDDAAVREQWTATAITAAIGADEEVAQNLAGFHQPDMLWVLEETPGVEMPIINTILQTATAKHNPICALGNPDHQHDSLGFLSAKSWMRSIRISAYDHPNVVCNADVIPGAVTKKSITQRLADANGDVNDPIFLGRVRGIPPAQSKRALILWDWCEEAANRWGDKELRDGPLALGVDVADSPTGDLSAISRWQGACCTEVHTFHAKDASEVGRIVYREMTDPHNPVDSKRIGIDAIGVGASTVNELKRLGVKVKIMSGGMKATPRLDTESMWEKTEMVDGVELPRGPRVIDINRYANQRSQVFWQLREDLRLGRIALPNDKKLFEELTALEYKDEEAGMKVTVMPKDKVRDRLGRSPDRADSVAYGNWVRSRVPERKREAREDDLLPQRNRDTRFERMMKRHEEKVKREEQAIRRRFSRKTP